MLEQLVDWIMENISLNYCCCYYYYYYYYCNIYIYIYILLCLFFFMIFFLRKKTLNFIKINACLTDKQQNNGLEHPLSTEKPVT